jgi:ribonucleoside-diphosphate reductase alpha chain
VKAENLWRKMLSMLFETGHPWMTFKDPCNLRSPQQHVGVVHSSNLCTEITLNTNKDEIAVCNLGLRQPARSTSRKRPRSGRS